MSGNRLHHLTWLYGIELFEADFHDRRFGKHSHEGFAIGAIVEGVGGYLFRGENMVLPQGRLSLMNPEEVHTGQAVAGQLRYKMLYASEEAVKGLLDQRHLRGFRDVTPRDHDLSLTRNLVALAAGLATRTEPGWRLEIEEAVQRVLSGAFSRFGEVSLTRPGREPRAVRLAQEVIDAHVEGDKGDAAEEDLSLQTLAQLADLHPNYLVRVFSVSLGISPHAYLIQRRVARAKAAILRGTPAIAAALDAGFYDQSHFIRHFRNAYGATPRQMILH